MKRLACSIAALCLAGSALAALEPDLRTTTLKNGLVVVLAPDPAATTADVAVWYRAGTRYEQASELGLAYLFGRMMFGGSKNHASGEHRRLLEAQGATLNSLTNPDYSVFYQTLPAGSIGRALELEADRMGSLAITPTGLAEARRAADEEREMRLSLSPVSRAIQKLYAVAFEGHPYARPVFGSASDLGRLTADEAVGYYRSRFSPDQAVLTVVGGFDPDLVMASVRQNFEALPRRDEGTAPKVTLAPQEGERRGLLRAPLDNRVLLMGWRGPGAREPDSPAMDVLAQILTGGLSSRLHLINARQFEFNGLEGDYDRSADASLVFCVAGVAAAADSDKAEVALVAGVESLAGQPVSDDDLGRAKGQLEARSLFSWQTSRGRAESLGAAQLLEGDARAAEARLTRIRAVTAADVQRVAGNVLRAESRSVVWVMPTATRNSRSSATGSRR